VATIAFVGAGSGVGPDVVRRVGRDDFTVALLTRNEDRVGGLAAELQAEGVTARGYVANVRDAPFPRSRCSAVPR
jgi:NADP-dependent 3-hydroxy acid dehydrogenase YdfG